MGARVGIAAIGALLAVVLQVVLAPNITIFGAVPSFVVAYCLAAGMLLPPIPAYVLAFVCGMLADLLGYGPVGAVPFLLLVAIALLQRVHAALGNGTLFVSLAILAAFALAVPLLHTAFVVATTSSFTALEAYGSQGISMAVYDCVLALVLYPLLARVLGQGENRLTAIATGTHLQ